jgi:hypothetical protein
MNDACSAVCLMCGRSPGFLVARTLVIAPGSAVRVQHRRLRCGRCHGSIVFETDDSLKQPDWNAQLQRDEARGGTLRRIARRRVI